MPAGDLACFARRRRRHDLKPQALVGAPELLGFVEVGERRGEFVLGPIAVQTTIRVKRYY
jgi:hypothetical protein